MERKLKVNQSIPSTNHSRRQSRSSQAVSRPFLCNLGHPTPQLPSSLISLMISVDVKHHVSAAWVEATRRRGPLRRWEKPEGNHKPRPTRDSHSSGYTFRPPESDRTFGMFCIDRLAAMSNHFHVSFRMDTVTIRQCRGVQQQQQQQQQQQPSANF